MADWEQLRELARDVVPPDLASLERTARRRQRRAGAVVGALAALLVAGGGIGIANLDDREDTVQPLDGPTESPTGTLGGAQPLPGAVPGEESVDVAAGRYRVPLDDTLAFEVDLPDQTSAHDDGLFLATKSFVLKTELAGETYGVPRDPCADHTIVPVGPSVDDLVRALTDLAAYQVSQPEQVRLGGVEATYLEARIPRTYDASACEARGSLQLPGTADTAVGGPPPYTGRWWVLEVHGHRVVVQQNCWGCSATEFDKAPRTPETITFTPTP